jgi:hypothetical protein
MGITIHYKGKLENLELLPSFMEELIDISRIMNWRWQVLDEDWSKPSTAQLHVSEDGATITGDLGLKGISIDVHPDCESLSLFFMADGILAMPMSVVMYNDGSIAKNNAWNSIKTQFAPPDVHISIIKLFKYLKKRYIPDLEVMDEGEYWEHEDKAKLIEKLRFIEEKMDRVAQVLGGIYLDNTRPLTAEQLGEMLEERFKKEL